MTIYFDNSATTRVLECAAKEAYKTMTELYGNPSSLHRMGIEAEKIKEKSRKIIAESLKVNSSDITFTSCATEASNIAIFGAVEALKRRGNRLITTTVEHPSVYECFKELEKRGYEVIYISPKNGRFDIADFEKAITKETILVSAMYVNNENGDILPVDKIKSVIKAKGSPALFHCDCVQAYGKLPVYPERMGIDLLSLSAHKLYGPKGIGVLYKGKGARVLNITYGGGQERGLRSGTENMAGIAAFGAAVEYVFADFKGINGKIKEVHDYFIAECAKRDFITVNSNENCADHIVNISLIGCRSETVLHCLEEKEIYVSSGSACSSHGGEQKRSRVMSEYGFDGKITDSAIRVSFGIDNTTAQVDIFMKEIEAVYNRLKR